VAIRDAFDEWHPATAVSGVIHPLRPKVMCVPILRRREEVPIPVEDVIVLALLDEEGDGG
jgi:hypothetical protein